MKEGDKKGFLTLLKSEMKLDSVGKRNRKYGIFLCDCGKTKEILLTSVRNSVVQSCGCYKSKIMKEIHTTHGMTNSPTYNTWHSMIQRCNAETGQYKDKNISVCQEWYVFENFLRDMGERPNDTTLDRINPAGNYEPSNCRWADDFIQAYNKTIRSTNTSGRTGVSFDKRLKKWQAYITYEKKFIVLGFFKTFEEAVHAREQAELKYHGSIKEDQYYLCQASALKLLPKPQPEK